MLTMIWGLVKGLGLTKHVGGLVVGAGKYVAGKWQWVLLNWRTVVMVALAAVIAFMLVRGHLATKQINQLEIELLGCRGVLSAVEVTISRNEHALNLCREVNAANAAAASELKARATRAQARLLALEARTSQRVEGINDESKQLRGRDQDCRTLDAPLPDWFDDWLRE